MSATWFICVRITYLVATLDETLCDLSFSTQPLASVLRKRLGQEWRQRVAPSAQFGVGLLFVCLSYLHLHESQLAELSDTPSAVDIRRLRRHTEDRRSRLAAF